MQVKPYMRRPQYYETDRMGIIHHSNYIRWFEEARIDLMEQAGYGYAKMEADGVGSPVIGVAVEYKHPVHFGGMVCIETTITKFTGSRMTVGYRVTDEAGTTLHATGETRHCFTAANGRPVHLKKAAPQALLVFEEMVAAQGDEPLSETE